MSISSGVYPCYENQFMINTGTRLAPAWKTIADCETFDCTFDNGVEEWHPFEHEGWVRRLQTAKSISMSVSGKRHIGDAGNDHIASKAWENGRDVEGDFRWNMPDGSTVDFMDAVISVTNAGSGDSTAVAPLEFDVQSNGKPIYTPASNVPQVVLSDANIKLVVGQTHVLRATPTPADETVSWTSGTGATASVNDGLVTALATGTSIITATITVDGTNYTDTCKVTVVASA